MSSPPFLTEGVPLPRYTLGRSRNALCGAGGRAIVGVDLPRQSLSLTPGLVPACSGLCHRRTSFPPHYQVWGWIRSSNLAWIINADCHGDRGRLKCKVGRGFFYSTSYLLFESRRCVPVCARLSTSSKYMEHISLLSRWIEVSAS